MELNEELRQELLKAQRTEITEYHVYHNIADILPEDENRRIVEEIGDDEKRHYEVWKSYTGKEVKPNKFLAWGHVLQSHI